MVVLCKTKWDCHFSLFVLCLTRMDFHIENIFELGTSTLSTHPFGLASPPKPNITEIKGVNYKHDPFIFVITSFQVRSHDQFRIFDANYQIN